MSLEVKKPILVVGLGGAGSRLATQIKGTIESDCLLISNDQRDLSGDKTIKIETDSIVNPSVQTIRGFAIESTDRIREQILGYSSIIMTANLAGRSGAAIAPIVSSICKEECKNLVSLAVMPFGYENDRIFSSGVSLKRIKSDSTCTIIIDNDAMIKNNPDLTVKECHKITNTAAIHIAEYFKSSQVPNETSVLTAGKSNHDAESSLRDALKTLYENAALGGVKSSIIHVFGGQNVPVGMMNTMSKLTHGVLGESTPVGITPIESDTIGVVMLSAVQGQTKFDGYDPLGRIPIEDTLDWDQPDCSYDCKLDLYQME